MFTVAELDQAFPNNPVDFRAAGFAGSQTNTKGLQALGLTASNPTGQLTGAAQQAADAQIIAQINTNGRSSSRSPCLKDFIRDVNAAGLTGGRPGRQPVAVQPGRRLRPRRSRRCTTTRPSSTSG